MDERTIQVTLTREEAEVILYDYRDRINAVLSRVNHPQAVFPLSDFEANEENAISLSITRKLREAAEASGTELYEG